VLPVALEKATSVMMSVVKTVKEYVCIMQLHGDIDTEKLKGVVEYFRGEIYQRPPLKSSVKRRLRVRRVHNIEVLEKKDRLVLMRLSCDPGTYVRKLCHDIGLLLGVGAHMRELRRVRSGPFTEETSVTLQEVSEALCVWRSTGEERLLRRVVMPVEKAVCHLPKIVARQTAVAAIAHGADLAFPGVAAFTDDVEKNRVVALFTPKCELIGLVRVLESPIKLLERKRGLVAHPIRIVMEPELYPRAWKRRKGEKS